MSAPTTEEVREALEQAAKAQDAFSPSMPAATAFFAVGAVLEDVALPLAEHRDALAAEVARLREAAAAVVACVGYDATMQRAVDRLASVLAEAKGAGR